MSKLRLVIIGYGNVGRGVRAAVAKNSDMELVGIVSRSPERVKREVAEVPVIAMENCEAELARLGARLAILGGGSKNDLPKFGPRFARVIDTVDSFDNHIHIPDHFAAMDEAAKSTGHVSVISSGWDPGIFSMERTLAGAFLPGSRGYGFYGLGPEGGLSMGHSDALRTIPGVRDARQFTHAIPEAIERVRKGENPDFRPGDMHRRECFVVLEPGADPAAISKTITEIPVYFAPYDTTINFVSEEELKERFGGFPHDGLVVAAGETGKGTPALIEYRCRWGSNPEATANVLVATARAAARLRAEGKRGAFTILDIPPAYFSPLGREELLKHWM